MIDPSRDPTALTPRRTVTNAVGDFQSYLERARVVACAGFGGREPAQFTIPYKSSTAARTEPKIADHRGVGQTTATASRFRGECL